MTFEIRKKQSAVRAIGGEWKNGVATRKSPLLATFRLSARPPFYLEPAASLRGPAAIFICGEGRCGKAKRPITTKVSYWVLLVESLSRERKCRVEPTCFIPFISLFRSNGIVVVSPAEKKQVSFLRPSSVPPPARRPFFPSSDLATLCSLFTPRPDLIRHSLTLLPLASRGKDAIAVLSLVVSRVTEMWDPSAVRLPHVIPILGSKGSPRDPIYKRC